MIEKFALIIVSLLFFWSCNSQKTATIQGDVAQILQAKDQISTIFRAKEGGGEENISYPTVKISDLELNAATGGIQLLASKDTSSIEIVPEALGLPNVWKPYSTLILGVKNLQNTPLKIIIEVSGVRGFFSESYNIGGESTERLLLDLKELPLISRGKRKVPPALFRIKLIGDQPQISLTSAELIPFSNESKALADRFGQRIKGDWPNKIEDVETMKAQAAKARAELSKPIVHEKQNQIGGWTSGPDFKSTGFFHLHKGKTTNGITHWWLIDPYGKPFWSLGVTGVRHKYPNSRSELTILNERTHLFKELPSPDVPEVYQDSMYSPYAWNITRKWGSIDEWRKIVDDRVRSWGLNTLGNWSDEGVLSQSKIPYTRYLASNGPGTVRLGTSRMVDVFDPSWEKFLDSAFSEIQKYKNDSLLIGYFVDNEQGWGGLNLLKKSHSSAALRQFWGEMQKKKYGSIDALNITWGTKLSSWEEVEQMKELPEGHTDQLSKDILALETQYAETYFSKISQKLKEYDPNHMYLGCRFTKRLKPAHVIASAGKYCDVITINNYSLVPQRDRMEQWHKLSGGRPILIGEHHLPLQSERQLPPPYPNFTAEERYKYYIEYEKAWTQMPFSVGSHWYQWVDQPLTGRASDGENQTVGLVDIVDQPHEEMLRAIEEISKNMYQWHSNPVF